MWKVSGKFPEGVQMIRYVLFGNGLGLKLIEADSPEIAQFVKWTCVV